MRTIAGMRFTVIAFACVALCGCATNRSEVSLATPGAATATARENADARPVVLRTVTDARVFEAKPRDPSVPSLGFDGDTDAAANVRAQAIGRKRNTYGMALGDVLLEPGQTVEQLVRREVTDALREAGYRVVPPPGPPGAAVIDVRVQDFWSWLTPGFWSLTVSTRIATALAVDGRAPIVVNVRNDESTLAATDGVWVDGTRKALERFRAAIVARKAELP